MHDDHETPPETLPELYWAVARRLRHATMESLAPWGIAPSHARALAVILRDGSIRPSELSGRLHVSPRSATDVIDALEEHGLVERRPDPSDRRATIVAVTPEGARVGKAVHAARSAESERVFGELSANDQKALRRILAKLAPQ